MAIVSNSSPVIAPTAIDRLSPLQQMFESIVIPSAVVKEIHSSIPKLPPWIREQEAVLPFPPIVLRPSLGNGEREAIALAIALGAEIMILDDLPARRTARAAGLNVIGTLGILLAAKRKGYVETIRRELDNLIASSFFVSPKLYAEILKAAGEKTL